MLKNFIALGLFLFLAEGQNLPQLCTDSTSMAFNATQLSGVWWEIARNPALSSMDCIKVNVTVNEPKNVLDIATTYSVSSSYLCADQTEYANISLDNANVATPNGYNFSYVDGIAGPEYAVYKLLSTDYINYALICGYTNATNNASSFGIVLMRDRNPNITVITDLENVAFKQYADFTNGTMPLVTQSPTSCYASSAIGRYSIFAAIYAGFYVLINVFI